MDKRYSEESHKKISEAMKGKCHSKETIKKMSESHKGKKHSKEASRTLCPKCHLSQKGD